MEKVAIQLLTLVNKNYSKCSTENAELDTRKYRAATSNSMILFMIL